MHEVVRGPHVLLRQAGAVTRADVSHTFSSPRPLLADKLTLPTTHNSLELHISLRVEDEVFASQALLESGFLQTILETTQKHASALCIGHITVLPPSEFGDSLALHLDLEASPHLLRCLLREHPFQRLSIVSIDLSIGCADDTDLSRSALRQCPLSLVWSQRVTWIWTKIMSRELADRWPYIFNRHLLDSLAADRVYHRSIARSLITATGRGLARDAGECEEHQVDNLESGLMQICLRAMTYKPIRLAVDAAEAETDDLDLATTQQTDTEDEDAGSDAASDMLIDL